MPTAFLDHPRPLAFAHRGGAAHAPENSWRAFEHAVGLGYGYLETDVQATADGALVAFHDRTLDRVTGQPGRVCRLTLKEIAGARIGGTEPIPVLEDVLGAWPDVRFNIDVKDAPAIAPLARVLRRTSAWDRVCVVSFSASRLRATRRALDRPVCMAASPLGTAMVRFGGPPVPRGSRGPRRGRLKREPPAAAPARRPVTVDGRPPRPLAERLAGADVRCVQLPAPVVTPSFIGRAHQLGLQVHVWTVNDRLTMEGLLDLGVDGIMTDETVTLREVLMRRGQWHPRVTG
ncbi:MAG TPA: glycerophosphodiester phosphodiesterase family protein [Streptosporangiaceae bacterium]|nr:glycerophosphodiester phosphodiesterase family protein [Streptosporangiaceae bacterium]